MSEQGRGIWQDGMGGCGGGLLVRSGDLRGLSQHS